MDAFFAGHQERRAVQNGVDEILHERCVLGGRVLEGNVDIPDFGTGERGLRGFAEIDGVGFVADESQLVVFENDFAARAANLEAICAGGLTSGGYEEARGAARPFEVDGDVVLDFDVVIAADLAKAAEATGACRVDGGIG